MILAPRHIERCHDLDAHIRKFGLCARLATQLDRGGFFDVLLLDQFGVLKDLYAMADVVFMGGSLVAHGGQNPIEAACFRRAILHGPHV